MQNNLLPEAFRVLIVDDSPDRIEPLVLIFKSVGYTVRSSQAGLDAIAIAAGFKPHVVLLDVAMSVIEGHAIADAIGAQVHGRDVVLIALTGCTVKACDYKQAHFDYVLMKPVSPAKLVRLLEMLRSTTVCRASETCFLEPILVAEPVSA